MKAKRIVKFKWNQKPSIDDVLKLTQGGKFFFCQWEKDSGEFTKRILRAGVKKGITGKGLNYDPKKKGLLSFYEPKKDMNKERFWTSVRINKIYSLTAGGIKYVWPQNAPDINFDIWKDGGEIDQRINKINELTNFINKI